MSEPFVVTATIHDGKAEFILPADLVVADHEVTLTVWIEPAIKDHEDMALAAGWQALLAMSDHATDEGPADLATNHDDYLYGDG